MGQALLFGAGLWILSGGANLFGRVAGSPPGAADPTRAMVLVACGALPLLRDRLLFGMRPWRPLGWGEASAGLLGVGIHQVAFAWAGAVSVEPFGSPLDWTAVAFFSLGMATSTGVEVVRRRTYAASRERSGLSTGGLFGVVRHPAFAADLVWSLCWALLTGSPWAVAAALATTSFLGTRKAIEDDRALERQDELGFRAWARRTNRFLPTLD